MGLRSFPFRGWELGNVTKDDGSEAPLFDVKEEPEMRRSVAAGARQDVLDGMWNDYVLADASGPLPRY